MFAICAAILTWENRLTKTRIVIFSDNTGAIQMVNNLTSGCVQCMKLIRILSLNNLKFDRRVFIKHIKGKNNKLSDSLSRLKISKFFKLAPPTVNKFPR